MSRAFMLLNHVKIFTSNNWKNQRIIVISRRTYTIKM